MDMPDVQWQERGEEGRKFHQTLEYLRYFFYFCMLKSLLCYVSNLRTFKFAMLCILGHLICNIY